MLEVETQTWRVSYSILFPSHRIRHNNVNLQGRYDRNEVLRWIIEDNCDIGKALSVSYVATNAANRWQHHSSTANKEEITELLVALNFEKAQQPLPTLDALLSSWKQPEKVLSREETFEMLKACQPLAEKLLAEAPGRIPLDYSLSPDDLRLMGLFDKVWKEAFSNFLQLPSRLAYRAGLTEKQYYKLLELRSFINHQSWRIAETGAAEIRGFEVNSLLDY